MPLEEPNLWNISSIRPPPFGGQGLEQAYITQPDRTLPNLRAGFRTWDKDRFTYPDPSWFFTTTDLRAEPWVDVPDEQYSFFLLQGSDGVPFQPVIDLPSSRGAATNEDGVPTGGAAPDDQGAIGRDLKTWVDYQRELTAKRPRYGDPDYKDPADDGGPPEYVPPPPAGGPPAAAAPAAAPPADAPPTYGGGGGGGGGGPPSGGEPDPAGLELKDYEVHPDSRPPATGPAAGGMPGGAVGGVTDSKTSSLGMEAKDSLTLSPVSVVRSVVDGVSSAIRAINPLEPSEPTELDLPPDPDDMKQVISQYTDTFISLGSKAGMELERGKTAILLKKLSQKTTAPSIPIDGEYSKVMGILQDMRHNPLRKASKADFAKLTGKDRKFQRDGIVQLFNDIYGQENSMNGVYAIAQALEKYDDHITNEQGVRGRLYNDEEKLRKISSMLSIFTIDEMKRIVQHAEEYQNGIARPNTYNEALFETYYTLFSGDSAIDGAELNKQLLFS